MCVPSKDEKTLFTSEVLSKKDFVVSSLNYTGGKTKLLSQILPWKNKSLRHQKQQFCQESFVKAPINKKYNLTIWTTPAITR